MTKKISGPDLYPWERNHRDFAGNHKAIADAISRGTDEPYATVLGRTYRWTILPECYDKDQDRETKSKGIRSPLELQDRVLEGLEAAGAEDAIRHQLDYLLTRRGFLPALRNPETLPHSVGESLAIIKRIVDHEHLDRATLADDGQQDLAELYALRQSWREVERETASVAARLDAKIREAEERAKTPTLTIAKAGAR